MFGGVFLLAAEKERCEDCFGGVFGDMWAGGASTLEAGVSAANPGDISRYGDNRNGFRLAAVSVLYCGQPNRLVFDALDWEEVSMRIDRHRCSLR